MLHFMYLQQETKGQLINGQPQDMPMFPEERRMKEGYGLFLKEGDSTRLTLDSSPKEWRSQPKLLAERLQQRGPFKVMDDAVTGVPQPKTGLPKRRPVFCEVVAIQPEHERPVLVRFRDPWRADRRYTYLGFAELQIRLPDPASGSLHWIICRHLKAQESCAREKGSEVWGLLSKGSRHLAPVDLVTFWVL